MLESVLEIGHSLISLKRQSVNHGAILRTSKERIPLERIGKPEEVAGPVVFLPSPAASLITDETLMVDGGWTIQ